MSNPQIKITETRSYTSNKSSKLDIQAMIPSPLPQAPLVSFDLHFDTLKDYLNNVTTIVNQQGSMIKTIIEELRTRVYATDIIEIFTTMGNTIPNDLAKSTIPRSGDDWKDSISIVMQKIAILSDKVLDLTKFKTQTSENILEIHEKIKPKADISYIKQKTKKAKKYLIEELKTRSEMILSYVKDEDDRLAAKINELDKKFAELELKTVWRLKDCEDLLKVRVNEKYVADAIAGLEDKLKKNLEESNRVSLSKFERQLKELEKELEKITTDHNSRIKQLKEDIHENLNKKSNQADLDAIQKEIETILKNLKSLNDFQINSKFTDLTSKLSKLEDIIKNLNKRLDENNFSEDIESLKSSIDKLKFELEKKADRSLVADVYSKANEPKQDQTQEKYDFNEFWKFREKTMEQIKNIENKLEKISKSAEMGNIKKILGTKANEEEVKSELSSHDFKLIEIDRVMNQNSKDIEALLSMLKKLNSTFTEFSSQSGLALLGRKQAAPQICLSCGRGDTNFAPIQPHVMGRDGKIYKADAAIGKSVKRFDIEAYDTGAEVFAMDTHEQAHYKRWEETESKEVREVKKIPLNVILGKEVRKSSSILPATGKTIRPQSAKNNFH